MDEQRRQRLKATYTNYFRETSGEFKLSESLLSDIYGASHSVSTIMDDLVSAAKDMGKWYSIALTYTSDSGDCMVSWRPK